MPHNPLEIQKSRKGFVKLENFRRSDNKLAYAYFLTPLGLEEKARITLSFLRIKEAEYEAIRREIGLLRIEANEISAANVDSKLQSSLQ
jgi:hypothetical protein